MSDDPLPPSPFPTALPWVEVDVQLEPGAPTVPLRLPARSPEEAFAMLISMGERMDFGGGITGAGAHQVYYGSVLEPIRDAYKARLDIVEREVLRRRALLGANPHPLELRGLAQWAARQRTRTARVARLPTPALVAGLEARDWNKYGPGGRTFENLMRHKAGQNLTGTAAYESILKSASTSNPKVNADIARLARHLRRGGAVLGAVGLVVTAGQIITAPPEQRGEVATRAAVSFAGGLIGSEIAVGLLTVGAGLLLGATPAGWLILGVGLIGGIAGGMLAEHIFFPPQAEPVAQEMGAGFAVDPMRPGISPTTAAPTGTTTGMMTGATTGATTGGMPGFGSTLLPIINRVPLTIRAGDTQLTITQRATRLAAASVGLPREVQDAFMARHSSATGLRWLAGDPTPGSRSSAVSARDVALSAGNEVIYELNDRQKAELTELVGR